MIGDPEWIVLDIDGVLLDVSRSYDRAVELTTNYFLDRKGLEADLSSRMIRSFRKAGQFGDDYKVTEGLVLIHLSGNPDKLLEEFPQGEDIAWLRDRVGDELNGEELQEVFDRFYFGGKTKPAPGSNNGLWRKEKPLVEVSLLEEIDRLYSLGFITGRSRAEVELAEKILNYEFNSLITRDQYRKPDPRALEVLVDGETGYYLGDTYNDKLLVENFRDEGNNFSFIMIDRENPVNEVLKEFIRQAEK